MHTLRPCTGREKGPGSNLSVGITPAVEMRLCFPSAQQISVWLSLSCSSYSLEQLPELRAPLPDLFHANGHSFWRISSFSSTEPALAVRLPLDRGLICTSSAGLLPSGAGSCPVQSVKERFSGQSGQFLTVG